MAGVAIQHAGILNIGGATANASTAGLLSPVGNVVNNGAINFNQTDSAALAQTIAGSGTLKLTDPQLGSVENGLITEYGQVPEPNAWIMLAGGLLTLVAVGRLRRA